MKNIIADISVSRIMRKLALVVAAIAAVSASAASHNKFTMSLDSAYILMGKQTGLKLQISDYSEGEIGKVVIPYDSLPPQIEVCDTANLPQLELEGKSDVAKALTATYLIQSFDSGTYRIPPFYYVNGTDTTLSNSLTIKVEPVDVSEMSDINASEPSASIGSRWYDILPDFVTDYWYWMVALLLLIAGCIVVPLILSKKIKVNVLPKKKIVPPYVIAIQKLVRIKEERLWEPGRDKTFYTELTDVLREYLERRFGINAMEMTSSQIVAALNASREPIMSKQLVAEILRVADFVKFAKATPLREDNIKSLDAAMKFVEDTKPLPVNQQPDGQQAPNAQLKVNS